MDDTYKKLDQFTDSEILQNKLESVVGKFPEGVAISYSHNGISSKASVNQFTITDPVQTGCIAKSLTATLVAIARHEHKIRFEDNIIYFFDDFSMKQSVHEQLSRIKIYHLLNHTHGLDHSLLENLPYKRNGYIDINSILRVVNDSGLSAPADVLSVYSNIGPWLVSAILECIYGQPYFRILNQKLFQPLGINTLTEENKVCPSIGGGLQLSAYDLMKIVNLHIHGSQDIPGVLEHLVALRTQFPAPVLKWPPIAAKFYPGWIDFNGSFGQLGFGENSAGVVRFLPDDDCAIVVTATHKMLANFVLATLFKEILSDFNNVRRSQLLIKSQLVNIDSSVYQGVYDNNKYRLIVDNPINGSLRAQVFLKQKGGYSVHGDPYIKRYYRPTTKHTFVSLQPEQSICPVLQFSHPQLDGLYQFINTGKFMFIRVNNI